MPEISTKPYLIRAIHEWCSDNGFTPYIAVSVDDRTIVPRAYVKGGEIVLNVSSLATNRLRIGNDSIEFEARFGGIARQISVPIDNVSAIYARENGHGMAFEVPKPPAVVLQAHPRDAAAGAQTQASGDAPEDGADTDGSVGAGSAGNAVDAAPERPGASGRAAEVDRDADRAASGEAVAPEGGGEQAGSPQAQPVPSESGRAGRRLTLAGPARQPGTDEARKPKPRAVAPVDKPGATPAGEREGADDDGTDGEGGGRGKRGKPRLTRVK